MPRDDEAEGRPTTAIAPEDLRQLVRSAKDAAEVRVAVSAPTAIAEVASGAAVTAAEVLTITTEADTATLVATQHREIVGVEPRRRAATPAPMRTADILTAAAARTRVFQPSTRPEPPEATAAGTHRVSLGGLRMIACATCGPIEVPASAGAIACPRCGQPLGARAARERTAWQWLVVALVIALAVVITLTLLP